MIVPTTALLSLLPVFQQPAPTGTPPVVQPALRPAEPQSPLGVGFDNNGYPLVHELPARAPGRPATWPAPPEPAGVPAAPGGEGAPPVAPADAPGATGLGSPLMEVFQTVRSPTALRALGGATVWWRLTVLGAQGEPIGLRELTHRADLGHRERDRIEHSDGRVYGRDGNAVFAERHGMPWPTLREAGQQELALFGVLLRAPWVFADADAFVIMGRDYIQQGSERFARVRIEARPATASLLQGPELTPVPRDRFELWCEPTSMEPRQLVYTLALSGETRRLLLEDWREVGGVRLPFRRTVLDREGRARTVLEVLRAEFGQPTAERDFRLR